MATAEVRSLLRDKTGAAFMEFTVVAGVMMTILFGLVEFAHLYSQWNAATKAVQVGARVAATGSPVWSAISTLNGLEAGAIPGDTLPSANYTYSTVCNGSTSSCTVTKSWSGSLANTYSSAAMNTIVYGRNTLAGGSASCHDVPGTYFGMCDVFKRIAPSNVRITYAHTGSGYATRPGGMVPTITLEIVGLNFQFVFLDDIMRLFGQNWGQVPIPGLRTTMIAEDMNSAAPSFPSALGNGGGNNGGGNNGGGNNGGGNNGNGNGNGNN